MREHVRLKQGYPCFFGRFISSQPIRCLALAAFEKRLAPSGFCPNGGRAEAAFLNPARQRNALNAGLYRSFNVLIHEPQP